ncbi:hypothetical protein GDO78_017756, partial [Eleutherodactylus coqui]
MGLLPGCLVLILTFVLGGVGAVCSHGGPADMISVSLPAAIFCNPFTVVVLMICLLQDKPLAPSKPDVNLLNTLCNGSGSRQKHLSDGVHRIRVDFKEACEAGNVWETGGLNILTTVPITPRVVCFLCASSGNVEFVFCQVCCEPFHRFCLEEKERPSEDQLENWCCRNCKFCHVCGRQQQVNK